MNYDQKILTFINVTNKILNFNFKVDIILKIDKIDYINLMLKCSNKKHRSSTSMRDKIYNKRMLLISQIFNDKISYKDIFDCTIQNIRSTNDKNIKTLCILGH
ncbi:hypothetical protein NAPIS_ORF00031 [Vairimorpha apis BRL 01]|uniref:Uncharacterized protein n=1 Tax=Vairimorpha apis BRL 01 TaxID=1037528 RepID=T0LDM9_9MICR|nr:hypothetical protein NAPIS_ORF00031 [Vairimorpha apis BRL 01]